MELDFILNGKASGPIASRLVANNMDAGVLRPFISDKDNRSYVTVNGKNQLTTNATLRKDEWKMYDTAILKVVQERLLGAQDLISRGLTYTTDGLGTTVLEYEDMSDIEGAQISMDASTRGKKDRPEYGINYLPLPIIHKDYQLNARSLAASRKTGNALDTTMAELAGRKVAEMIEQILFLGTSTYTYGGGTIYGYLDFPSRNTFTLDAHWDDSAATGETILADLLAMKQKSINAMYYGPWVLYIPTNFETALDEDFKAGSDKSVRQRLLEVSGISDIRVVDMLTADNILLVQMTSDVIRLVQGLQVTVVEWSVEGGMITNYKVMAIMVPQPRADQEGHCGITHGTK
jgi:uncharacterized linocin/CFP29 family protein